MLELMNEKRKSIFRKAQEVFVMKLFTFIIFIVIVIAYGFILLSRQLKALLKVVIKSMPPPSAHYLAYFNLNFYASFSLLFFYFELN